MANTLKFGNGEWYGKKDTILAYNDENRNYKPLPFDFSRASSATVINKDGLIEEVGSGQPRIDFLGNTKGAMLLEPSRTNLITQSEAFDNAYWTKGGSSIISDNAISPDGSLNADKLVEDSSNSFHGFYQNANISLPIGKISMSIFVKSNGRDYFQLRTGSTSGITGAPLYANFDLTNNSVTASSSGVDDAKIESFSNNWKKVSISFTATSVSQVSLVFQTITTSSSAIGETYQGDGTSGVYIFGAQVEQGSYPTSYIPTQGSAVTRLADSCSQTTPDGVVGQTEGTLYADVNFVGVTEAITNQIFFLREQGSNNGYLFAGFYQGKLNCGMRVGGSLLFDTFFSSALTKGRYKIAIAYKSGDTKIYVNGVQTGFKNNSFGVTNFAEILLTGSAGTNQLGDINREFKLYNTRLTDQELQALTQV